MFATFVVIVFSEANLIRHTCENVSTSSGMCEILFAMVAIKIRFFEHKHPQNAQCNIKSICYVGNIDIRMCMCIKYVSGQLNL